ncbi:MAG TPA: hypothetical protein VFQ06_12795, partial [Nitrospira sp.]|nr:hypothetical protein [Nitrospira sp.]
FVRMLGLMAVAAAAMMAFAATASADEITSSPGVRATSLHATSEGYAVLDAPFGTVKCNSTVAGTVTDQGPGKHVTGSITTLDWSNCTDGKTVFTKINGTLTLDVTATDIGTVWSRGAEVQVIDHNLGIECVYTTSTIGNGTHIGTATGTVGASKDGTLDIDSALIPRTGGSFFCGGSGEWTGSYAVTSPSQLHLDAN